VNEATWARSFGQTYPLKKGVGVKLTSFFYKGERENLNLPAKLSSVLTQGQ